jgi:hypothetical protein
MVRLASLGKDGRVLRNALVNTLWMDLETRSKQLGVSVETLLSFGLVHNLIRKKRNAHTPTQTQRKEKGKV